MIEYINMHQSGFWIATGFILIAAELLLFGFTTIVLLFSGIGAVITGLAMMSGILPETWLAGIACFGLATGIVGAALWKPLKNMQDNNTPVKQSSDLIGYQFILKRDISALEEGSHRYSGIDWKVVPDAGTNEKITAGTKVQVTSLEAGIFRVKAI